MRWPTISKSASSRSSGAPRLQEQLADPEVHLGELPGRDERISGLLHPVVEEAIGAVPAEQQPLPHGLLERLAELLRRPARDDREGVEVQAAAEAGGELERVARRDREPLELADHQLDDVVGEALVADGGDVPPPCALVRVEGDEPLLVQGDEELEHEEGVAAGLLVDELRERLDLRFGRVDRLGDERPDVGGGERRRGRCSETAAPRFCTSASVSRSGCAGPTSLSR